MQGDTWIDGTHDATTLEYLDTEILLKWMKERYLNKNPYGYIGDSLVAVNPCEKLSIYDVKDHERYSNLRIRSEQTPHIFWIADHAYQTLVDSRVDQCVLVSGDSGAGKTESTKYLLNHLVQREKSNSDLVDRLERVNPLLELFGNAATVLNSNSSRFGKLVELEYELSGSLCAAKIECFILEKFRVTSRNDQEKNFHVFYAVFAGMPTKRLIELSLEDNAPFYRILSRNDGYQEVFKSPEEKQKYKEDFKKMETLLRDVGFSSEEVEHLYKVIAAILLVANIEFDSDDDGHAVVTDYSEDALCKASDLLDVDPEELEISLTCVKSQAGSEEVIRKKSSRQANDGRDALARELYSTLFYGIIDKVNQKLSSGISKQRRVQKEDENGYIRILDISGFENVNHNGFEQLLINAANERLHSYFLQHMFLRERDEYEKEEVDLIDVSFSDNTPILDLIFKKPHGIFPLVDDQLSIPQSTDKTFVENANRYNSTNDYYIQAPPPERKYPAFGIKHYAGEVTYNARGFLEKNSETLPNNLKDTVEQSTNVFVRDYFLLGSKATLSATRGGRSSMRRNPKVRTGIPTPFAGQMKERTTGRLTGRVTEHFKTSLDHMMNKLATAKPLFIRCIKPNLNLKPGKFESRLVREQLSCSGMLEVATIRKAGFPIRIAYPDFVRRFSGVIEGMAVDGSPTSLASAIVKEAGITDHQFGKTKMFLKMYHQDQLEKILAQKKAEREAAIRAERERKEAERRVREEQKAKERSSPLGRSTISTISETGEIPSSVTSESGLGTRSSSREDLEGIEEEDEEEEVDGTKEKTDEEKNEEDAKTDQHDENIKDLPAYMAFRVTERDFDHSTNFEVKVLRACRFILYILISCLLLGSGVASVVSLIWMSKSIPQTKDKSHPATLVMLCQLFPVLLQWLFSFMKSLFGRKEWPTLKAIIAIVILDSLQNFGKSILIFKIYPSTSAVESIVIGLAIFQAPCFLKLLTHILQRRTKTIEDITRRKRKRCMYVVSFIFFILAFSAQIGGLPLLVFRQYAYEKLTGTYENIADSWPLFLFAACTTVGLWDNFLYGVLVFGRKQFHVGLFRRNIQRVRETCYIYSGLVQIVLITVFTQFWLGDQNIDVFKILAIQFEDYGTMWNRERGVIDHFTNFGMLYIQLGSTLICSYTSGLACRLQMQRLAFGLPIVVIPLGAASVAMFCFPEDYLRFFIDDKVTDMCRIPTFDLDLYFVIAVGGLLWISFVICTVHIWNPDCERMAKLDRLFMFNHRDGVFPYQTLAARRRQDEEVRKELNHKAKKEDHEEEDLPMVYVCATMWHETRQEMVQLLKSLFRLDFDICARRIAAKKFSESTIDNYDCEIHIIFDDAFETDPESRQRVMNSWVRQLIGVLPEAVNSVAKGRMELNPFSKIVTPYGGRLTFEMPGGTSFNVHMKDKEKIRHKKRWSQIMYLYYLLGHKLVGEYETVGHLFKDKSAVIGKGRNKDKRRRKKHRIRPFTSVLNNLPDEVVRKAENTFIMTLDGDVDFRPDAVRLLIDRMKKNKKVAAVCGRIHPIGDGPMVWYQQFEYAIGHWLQKAAEHVFGCVMCCPGCFSLLRGSALMDDNVMRMYAIEPTEARHYVQFEQGEDRWLCTLLLQQGWKIDYCAGSDAFTYAPETFNDFYIQRRRWSPSTMANIMDLLGSWRSTVKMNDNLSTLFFVYQFVLMASSIIAPGAVVFMIGGAYNAVINVNMTEGYVLSVLPVALYIILCLKAKTNTQVKVAALMSAVYCIIMMVVTVGLVINVVTESFYTPIALFLAASAGLFVITALLHPKEVLCLVHGILYYLTVPSTFVFLTVFFLCNLNVVSWGTRESPKKVDTVEELDSGEPARKGKIRKFLDSLGLVSIIHDIKAFIVQIVGSKDQRATPTQGLTPGTSVITLDKLEEAKPVRIEKKQQQRKVKHDPTYWAKDCTISPSEPQSLDAKETKFWNDCINEFLLPLKANKEQQDKIKEDLLSARNNVVFAYFLLNLMFTIVILQLQVKKDLLQKTFYILGKYEPVSVVFLVVSALLLLVQFSGCLTHQWGTFLHLVASTRISWFKRQDHQQKSLDAIRETQKLQSAYPTTDELLPYEDDLDGSLSVGSELEPDYDEDEPDYNDEEEEEEDPNQHVSQYERNFRRNFKTVRRHFDRNPRHRPHVPTVARNFRHQTLQRRHDLYMSTVRRRMTTEGYDPPDYV